MNKNSNDDLDKFPCFVKNGKRVEDPACARNDEEKYKIIARNALRHLTYGVPLRECKLLTGANFSALFINRDDKLLAAVREELQNIFANANHYVNNIAYNTHDLAAENRFEVFIKNLLAVYPFLNPQQNEHLLLPQKVNGKWQPVEYAFEKIDISPQSGLLSKLIEDEDRLYAYGLVPCDRAEAKPYLLFMGSAYPSSQGAEINWLYNFKPNYSVGEGHDTTFLDKWIKQHNNITTIGHSKGGTMAMITAAKYPKEIAEADCLNPTALNEATIRRLNPRWLKTPSPKRPHINVFTQMGDPVFYIEKRFLSGTNFYQIWDKAGPTNGIISHIHYLAGREYACIKKLDTRDQEINPKWRDFVTQNKQALNWIIFPILYTKLCLKLAARKAKQLCDKAEAIFKSSFLLGGTTAYTLFSGLGSSLPLSLCAATGLLATYCIYKSIVPCIKIASSATFSMVLAGAFFATVAAVALLQVLKESAGLFWRSKYSQDTVTRENNYYYSHDLTTKNLITQMSALKFKNTKSNAMDYNQNLESSEPTHSAKESQGISCRVEEVNYPPLKFRHH